MYTDFASTRLSEQSYSEEWKRSKPDYIIFKPTPEDKPNWNDPNYRAMSEQIAVIEMPPRMEGHIPLSTFLLTDPNIVNCLIESRRDFLIIYWLSTIYTPENEIFWFCIR